MGGALVLASTATVSVASHRREARQASKEAASRAIQRILSSGSEEAAEAGSLRGDAARRRPDAAAAEACEEDSWGRARPQAKQGESPGSRGMAGWPEGPPEPSGKPPDDH